MKIKRLWVSEYKNIKDLTLEFNSSLISLLVGKNGLGKSNLIEILALIFRDLDLLETKAEFLNWSIEKDHFEYKIKYECKGHDIVIFCLHDDFKVRVRDIEKKNPVKELTFSEFKELRKTDLLPDYIIGYYSGENKRIREVIRPYEELVWKDLKNNEGLDKGLRRMFFAENHHSFLVLLSVLLFRQDPPSEEFKERLDYLIKEFTSFQTLERLTIRLKNPSWYKRAKNPDQRSIEFIVENLLPDRITKEPLSFPFWNAKGKADSLLGFLYDISLDLPNSYYDEEDQLEHLDFEFQKDRLEHLISENFKHPADFFDAFDSLYVIDSVLEIILTVWSEKRDLEFSFDSLSEGEQQLITVLGLVLIVGRDDCLFLLDEPDTHLNPNWQRRYVDLLHYFNLNNENSHMIVATHSPLIVQATEKADIFLFKKSSEDTVEVVFDDFKIKNWRIDHVLMSQYFDLNSSRPLQVDDFTQKRKEIIAKGTLSDEDRVLLESLKNELGYLPTGETIEEIEDKIVLRETANQIRSQQ